MKKFKEWLSDNLRYFVLAIAVIAVIFILFFGYKLLGNMMTNGDGSKKQTEETKPGSEKSTEDKKATEKTTESQKQTQKTETSKSTEKTTEKTTGKTSDSNGESSKASESGNETSSTNAGSQANTQTEATEAAVPQNQAPETEAPAQTEATEAPVPQTMYMNAAAYIREAPSYEGAILDTLQAGQAVTFLEDVGGWYKVEANGYVGYVGARFFN